MDRRAHFKPTVGDTVEYQKPHHGVVKKVTPTGNLLVKDFESNHDLLLEPNVVKKVYSYDRRTAASSHYTPLFTELVHWVDDVEATVKAVTKAEQTLEKLQKVVSEDEDIRGDVHPSYNKGQESNKMYGAKQQLQDMQEAIDAYRKAGEELGRTYDRMNSWFLEHTK